jgi:hypothetical protein
MIRLKRPDLTSTRAVAFGWLASLTSFVDWSGTTRNGP